MAGRKHIVSGRQQKPRLVITENFLKELETVILYGHTIFGDIVAKKFQKEILDRIFSLPLMPHANPKSRFVESTERKVYRNIVYEKYYVVYSVTKTTIRVISIVYQATNPKKLSKIK